MKYLFLLGCSFAVALAATGPVLAQDAGQDTAEEDSQPIILYHSVRDDLITVVATGGRQRLDWAGQPISVIGQAELDAIQGPDLIRSLERLPGVTLTRNGGLGGFTGLRVRGADAEQLLVLIDGVRVADVAAPAGGYDLGNLLGGDIAKIELLRGSNSVVWGSQAMGGVLAVTSKAASGGWASAEYGSRNTFSGNAGAGVAGTWGDVSLGGGYTRSDGISTFARGAEPDGFRQWNVKGRARVELANGLNATLTARYLDANLAIDGFPAPAYAFADTPEYQTTQEASGRAGLEYQGSKVSLKAGYALTDIRRSYFDPTFGTAPNYQTFGRSQRADISGHADLPSDFTVDFGIDSEWSRFRSSFDPLHTARLSSGHALLGYHSGGLNLAGGVRLDDHSRFGSHWTFGANGSYDLGGDWRIRASYGEGFKAPTLFQLLSDYGNLALRPETSRSFDAGIEKGDRNGGLHLAATLFRRDSRDLIDFVSCFGVTTGICAGRPFGTYNNVARARAEGFELEADARVTDTLMLRAAYSYVKAVNRGNGKALSRRPRHALSLSADWTTPLGGLVLGADLRSVSKSFDDAGNFTPIKGYTVATLRASLPLGERFELYGRVENLGDAKYQTAAGYGTAGRSVFAGARAKF